MARPGSISDDGVAVGVSGAAVGTGYRRRNSDQSDVWVCREPLVKPNAPVRRTNDSRSLWDDLPECHGDPLSGLFEARHP
jgi:hypothetical protein